MKKLLLLLIIPLLSFGQNLHYQNKTDLQKLNLYGNIKRVILYDDNSYINEVIHFDKDGNIHIREQYSGTKENELRFKLIHIYTANRLEKLENRGKDNEINSFMLYSYDSKNNLLKNEWYSENKKLMEWDEYYGYDIQGYPTSKKHYIMTRTAEAFDTESFIDETFYTYDDNYNIIEEKRINSRGEISSVTTFKYDNLNNIIESSFKRNSTKYNRESGQIETSNSIKTVEYKLEYLNENWIKKITIPQSSTTTRKIYFY